MSREEMQMINKKQKDRKKRDRGDIKQTQRKTKQARL